MVCQIDSILVSEHLLQMLYVRGDLHINIDRRRLVVTSQWEWEDACTHFLPIEQAGSNIVTAMCAFIPHRAKPWCNRAVCFLRVFGPTKQALLEQPDASTSVLHTPTWHPHCTFMPRVFLLADPCELYILEANKVPRTLAHAKRTQCLSLALVVRL